jgi:ribonuclease P protein component
MSQDLAAGVIPASFPGARPARFGGFMRFRPEQHLRRPAEFEHVRAQGRRYDAGAFVVFYAERPKKPAPGGEAGGEVAEGEKAAAEAGLVRAGFVASRAAVGNAVQRARAKRRLREQFRLHQERLMGGHDFIFQARRTLNRLEPAALAERFSTLCRHLTRTP